MLLLILVFVCVKGIIFFEGGMYYDQGLCFNDLSMV